MTGAFRPAILALAAIALSGCAVHVHGDPEPGRSESCSVHCEAGGRARVSCEKPQIPACSCEPVVTAVCIHAATVPSLRRL